MSEYDGTLPQVACLSLIRRLTSPRVKPLTEPILRQLAQHSSIIAQAAENVLHHTRCTERDLYYRHKQLFSSQSQLHHSIEHYYS